MTTVRISTAPVSIDALLAAADGARMELEKSAVASLAAARAVVTDALEFSSCRPGRVP
jgi:hypothetical protein